MRRGYSSTMSRRRIAAALVGLFALLAAGCGGDGGEELGSGADVAPAGSALFIALDTEFEGDQWRAAERLADRFPGGREAVRNVLRELEEDDVDFERDVKPAVGPEVDLVVLDLEDDDAFVLLTKPRDEEKFEELVKKGDEPAVVAEIDGWTAAAETQETLDRFEEARGDDSLADTEAFEDAMAELPDDALAKLYVSGASLTEQVQADQDLGPDERRAFSCFFAGGKLPSFAFALRAEEEGARMNGAYRAEGQEEPETYEAALASELPAGALFYASFNDLAQQVRRMLRCAGDADEDFDRQLAQAELALGVSIENDLLPLVAGEGALAVYRAPESQLAQNATEIGIPTVTLVTSVEDEAKARATVDKIARRASAFADEVDVEETRIDGVAASRVTIGPQATIFYAVFEGKLVVTSSEQGILGLREEGTRLADDPVYKGAREAAGAPDEGNGFVYANLAEAVTYFLRLAETSGEHVPPDVRANLEPLHSLFFYGTANDDKFTFEGFLEVE